MGSDARRIAPLAAALAAAGLGCAVPAGYALGGRLDVTDSGARVDAHPRPEGCEVAFLRMRTPDRAYDELATFHAFAAKTAAAAQASMRDRACAIGADAVVVTRDFMGGAMTGTAIRYRDRREELLRDERLKQTREAFATALDDPASPSWVDASITRAAVLRSRPESGADPIRTLEPGAKVRVAPAAEHGFRQLRLEDGTLGFVEEGVLRLGADGPAAGQGGQSATP